MSKLYARCIKPTQYLIKNEVYLVTLLKRKNLPGSSFTYYNASNFSCATHLRVHGTAGRSGYNLIVKRERFEQVKKKIITDEGGYQNEQDELNNLPIQDRIKNTKKGEKVELTDLFHQPKQQFDYKPMEPQPIYNLIHNNRNLNLLGVHRGTLAKHIRDNCQPFDDYTIQKIYWNGKELVTKDVTDKLKWEPKIP